MRKRRALKDIPISLSMAELNLQKHVQAIAKANGWKYHHECYSLGSDKGWPDLVLVRERVVYVELKKEMGIIAPEQTAWLDLLKSAGQEVYVWRPMQLINGTVERVLRNDKILRLEGFEEFDECEGEVNTDHAPKAKEDARRHIKRDASLGAGIQDNRENHRR